MLPALGLVMIVKDEEAVIERALRSALPYISTYLIVDTGSTDRTKEIIREVFADISGEIVDRPWINFGVNRSEALALCDGRMKWAMMMDADDNIVGAHPPSSLWERDDIDGFMMHLHHGSLVHRRLQVFRTGIGWRYEGIVHETPICEKSDLTIAVLPEVIYMETRCEGVRSRNPQKYADDAFILEKEVEQDPTNTRTVFHLAQSYRDAKDKVTALKWYTAYTKMQNADIMEKYMAYMNMINLSDDEAEQLRYAWAGINLLPKRLEVPYALFIKRRTDGRPITQEMFAMANMTSSRVLDKTQHASFPEIYAWGFDNERTVIAANTGHPREAYESALRCAIYAPTEAMRQAARHNIEILEKQL
jgi:glycosyltransferase involved in cell wall biosynthesis